MLNRLIDELKAELMSIEQNATLGVETNFVARTDALDQLTFHILERIENGVVEYGYRQELVELQQCAESIRQRLERVNDQLFNRLRHQLTVADDTASLLHQLCLTYTGGYDVEANARNPLAHDRLDRFIDGLFDIADEPEETLAIEPGMIGYQPTPARFIFNVVEHLNLKADDVFYDLGAGLGRVVLLVSLLSQAQVKGIELEPAYCAFAQKRIRVFNLQRTGCLNVDAREADYTDGTVFFMYTPFTGHVLHRVLDRLQREAETRQIRVATYGPCTDRVVAQSWLTLSDHDMLDEDLAIFNSRA